jgi:hypothetical protein
MCYILFAHKVKTLDFIVEKKDINGQIYLETTRNRKN